jgi:hypothetical protein
MNLSHKTCNTTLMILSETMNVTHSGVGMSAAVCTAGHNNKNSDVPVDNREEPYCIEQQCQINSFHTYTRWLFSSLVSTVTRKSGWNEDSCAVLSWSVG